MAKDEKIKHITFNGMTIPNTCDCIWCGSIMERKGPSYFGSGTNSFTMWCNNCGAIAHFARNSSRKISSFNIEYKCDEVTGGD